MKHRRIPEMILILAVFLILFLVFSMKQEELFRNLSAGISEASGEELLQRYWIIPVRELLLARP